MVLYEHSGRFYTLELGPNSIKTANDLSNFDELTQNTQKFDLSNQGGFS